MRAILISLALCLVGMLTACVGDNRASTPPGSPGLVDVGGRLLYLTCEDWSFLADQEITLTNTKRCADYEILKQLAVLLVQSGAKSVGLIDPDHLLQWFIPEKMKGEAV